MAVTDCVNPVLSWWLHVSGKDISPFTIISLLEEWGLLEVIDDHKIKEKLSMNQVKVISFSEKHDWELVPKLMVENGR